MAIALVSGQNIEASSDSPGTSITAAFPSSLTAANLVIAMISWHYTGSETLTSVTDANGNALAAAATGFRDSGGLQQAGDVWYKAACTAGASTMTASFGASYTFRRLIISEWSGGATASALETTANAFGSSTTATSGTMTITSTGCLVLGYCNDGTVPTVGAGFTSLATNSSDDRSEYQVQTTATNVNLGFGISPSAAWGVCAAVFRPAAAVTPTYEQEGYRWYQDGSESASTALANQDTDITQPADTDLGLRIIVNATNDPPKQRYHLQAALDGTTNWFPVEPRKQLA